MASVAPKDVEDIVKNVAKNEKLTTATFTFHERNIAEEGYMGDLFFATINDEKTQEVREVMVKRVKQEESVRANFPLAKMYMNETKFYEYIWAVYQKFQESIRSEAMFNKIAKCYATDMEVGKEKLVLENLKSSSFKCMKRNQFFDKEHFELIFSEYGKFHGLSMAYKIKFPKSFNDLSSKLYDYWSGLDDMKVLKNGILLVLQECSDYLAKDQEKELLKKFKELVVAKGTKGFLESTEYKGKHAVIIHGDCWSSNLMFQHDSNKKVKDMRMVDFQLSKLGTPVYDLSYVLYSGGSKEIFAELDHYLGVYHQALTSTLADFQCDENMYPLKELKEEWKTYSKFGFLMGLLTLKESLKYEAEAMDIAEIIENIDRMKEVEAGKYNEKEVHRRSVDLIKHMHTSGFLQ